MSRLVNEPLSSHPLSAILVTWVWVMFESLFHRKTELESFQMNLGNFKWARVISSFENGGSSHDSLQLCKCLFIILLNSSMSFLFYNLHVCINVIEIRNVKKTHLNGTKAYVSYNCDKLKYFCMLRIYFHHAKVCLNVSQGKKHFMKLYNQS